MTIFRTRRRETNNFDTPIEMYQDNKKKKINGPLDYQSKMINQYMSDGFDKQDVAIELPTGAGKTLVGLLIAEFRRRKYKEKVVYVCPNNQLVKQVVKKANELYGIRAVDFTGSRRDYDPESESAYERASAVAVTNYSSLFNTNTFFDNAEIIIFDDAHGAESYIVSNWSLELSRTKHKEIYETLRDSLVDVLEPNQYSNMKNFDDWDDYGWCDKLANIRFINKINEITQVLEPRVEEYDELKYPWKNIKANLHACNMFLSKESILIRPYIPPTLTYGPFCNAKQRIYMSATLGESGELERIIGVSKIHRLPMVEEWKGKSIGRRFFLFPNASFKNYGELFIKINNLFERALFLVQDNKSVKIYKEFIQENTDSEVFLIKDIENNLEDFSKNNNAVAILANRYDGIDMEGDTCHLLMLNQLPNGTHLQERFLTTKMSSSILFEERVRTKVIQAVGRCTRSATDYAVVLVVGRDLLNIMASRKKIEKYPPELQAEIEFGYMQSEEQKDYQNILTLVESFLNKDENWDVAEEEILGIREDIISKEIDKEQVRITKVLKECAILEVSYQYYLWKEDYLKALEVVQEIIMKLDGKALIGYKSFWNYIAGYLSYQIYNHIDKTYLGKAKIFLENASQNTRNVTWFKKLLNNNPEIDENAIENGLEDCIERIEKQFLKIGIRNDRKFEKEATEIIKNLECKDGNNFERGHLKLGELLGYISGNSEEVIAPDPWWIINDYYCIVSEDKIYEGENPSIPPVHVRQALTHETWIREKIPYLNKKATIITVMISNTNKIGNGVSIIAEDTYYLNRDEFVDWARKAIQALRELRHTFYEEGDRIWRLRAETILSERFLTPADYINFVKRKKVKDL